MLKHFYIFNRCVKIVIVVWAARDRKPSLILTLMLLFYLSWWKNPWNICRSLWVCVGHSPAAQWSALYGLHGRRLQEERGRHTKTRQTTDCRQTVSQSQAHSGCEGGGLRKRLKAHTRARLLQRLGCTDLQIKIKSNMATRHYKSFANAVSWTLDGILTKFPYCRWQIHTTICGGSVNLLRSVISLLPTGLFIYFNLEAKTFSCKRYTVNTVPLCRLVVLQKCSWTLHAH